MALLFTNAVSNRVENNSTDSLDNLSAGTMLAWIYRTTSSADRFIFCKGRTVDSRAKYVKINSSDNGQGAGSIQLGIYRATTPLLVEPTSTGVTADTWICAAATWDTSLTDSDQHVYLGSLTSLLAEPGAYTVRQVGSGTVADDSLDIYITGNYEGNALSFAGRIAVLSMWNRQLTLPELWQQQFHPHKTAGCVKFTHYGEPATQTDWSGNQNFGTVTGATPAPHVPIMPFVFGQSYGQYAIAASSDPRLRIVRSSLRW